MMDNLAWFSDRGGGEANLILPDLSLAVIHGITGKSLLLAGMGICVLGLAFGLYTFVRLRSLPVHRSMLEGALFDAAVGLYYGHYFLLLQGTVGIQLE